MVKIYIVSALLIFKEKILLIWSPELNSWMLPSTRIILEKENPEESICRQIKESINYDIKIIGVNSIYFEDDNSKILNTPLITQEYLISNNSGEKYSLVDFMYLSTLNENISIEKNEDKINSNYHWFSKNEIYNLLLKSNNKKIILKAFEVIEKSKEYFSELANVNKY